MWKSFGQYKITSVQKVENAVAAYYHRTDNPTFEGAMKLVGKAYGSIYIEFARYYWQQNFDNK